MGLLGVGGEGAGLLEFRRLGGIGIGDFLGDLGLTVALTAVAYISALGELSPRRSNRGATLAVMSEVEMKGVGGAVLDSGVGAGAGAGRGSVARPDRLQVRAVLSLEGLSWAGS